LRRVSGYTGSWKWVEVEVEVKVEVKVEVEVEVEGSRQSLPDWPGWSKLTPLALLLHFSTFQLLP
jgi:hypothetical protein